MKLLASLLLIFAGGAYAAERPMQLESVGLENISDMFMPPVSPAVSLLIKAEPVQPEERYFNAYILKAVDYLYSKYGLRGYDINSILTHDIKYHTYGVIPARHAPLTMCVAAQMEVILTAYEIYSRATGDYSVYAYLPKSSFEGLSVTDIKGHIWVNPKFNANGTADALINFGMGERRTFENLKPGDFVNINRTTKTGHAVTFIAYINSTGKVLPKYDPASVVGFKYFSSQGLLAAGKGGFDYRYAVFSVFGCPEMPYKRDCNVIYSADQKMLNTGTMTSPKFWTHVAPKIDADTAADTVLNPDFFDGITTDD
ncbi:MAG: hypothetical protein A2270_04325 [Elusimicrobia bacterium RIFOXYA12_FULL_51_18]|nr:MAG: hypothetical protein A2270_04325 [Elusimicrobia bacterium RIFOXYA12_FULL_51_18]OGS30057.1 MAG: hypothetical protein A2218_13000 [Elusimicrobia bacterium RIFOXYA2_FULL_53_38]